MLRALLKKQVHLRQSHIPSRGHSEAHGQSLAVDGDMATVRTYLTLHSVAQDQQWLLYAAG